MNNIETMKLALEALEIVNREMLTLRDELAERGGRPKKGIRQLLWDSSHKVYTDTAIPTAEALRQAIEQAQKQEPVTIWYMRDNHTFKKLSEDVSTALIEIEQEFNEGHTYGMLCSKRKGFPSVHASGDKKRLEFFAECKATLEQWLPKTSPPPRQLEPVIDKSAAIRIATALGWTPPRQPEQAEPVAHRILRRGDVLRCIETDELCTAWSTSTTGKTLVKWSANNFGEYTAEQIGDLFWLEPAPEELELAAEKSDNYAAFHAGYRFAIAHTSPPPRQPLTDEEIERIYDRYGGNMTNCARAIERAHGIKGEE